MIQQNPRSTVAKGRRPYFFDDPNIDKLLAMNLALMGEVSVLRDRLDMHEKLAAAGKPATPENIEQLVLSEDEEDQRATQRAQSIDRVLRIIKQSSEENIEQAEKLYQQMVDEFSK